MFAPLMDYAKTLKLQFSVGYLDLPERRGNTSSREEEEDALVVPLVATQYRRTHVMGEREIQGGTG